MNGRSQRVEGACADLCLQFSLLSLWSAFRERSMSKGLYPGHSSRSSPRESDHPHGGTEGGSPLAASTSSLSPLPRRDTLMGFTTLEICAGGASQPATILLIDGSKNHRAHWADQLKRCALNNYEIVEASDGQSAFLSLYSHRSRIEQCGR
jgi:hypothetical protein